MLDRRVLHLIIILGGMLANAAVSVERPAPSADRPREELPKQAAARLGSTSFRHGAEITSLAVSADGKYLATGSRDATVRIWDASTGHLLRSRACQSAFPAGAQFSPDGAHLIAGLDHEKIQVFIWRTDEELRSIAVPAAEWLRISREGGWIGSDRADEDGVQVSDHSGAQRLFFKSGKRLAFSDNGKLTAVAMSGGTIEVVTTVDGKTVQSIPALENASEIADLCFDPAGGLLVVAYASQSVVVWDIAAQKKLVDVAAAGPVAVVPRQAAFAAIAKGRLTIFDLKTGERKQRLGEAREGLPFAFLPTGERVFIGGPANRIRAWDVGSGTEIPVGSGHEAEVTALHFTVDGNRLLSSGLDGLRLWDLAAARELPAGKRSGPMRGLALSPSNNSFASSDRGAVSIWAPLQLAEPKPYADRPELVMPTTNGRGNVVAYGRDSRLLLSDSPESLALMEPLTGANCGTIRLPGEAIAAAFDFTGRRLAVVTADGRLRQFITSNLNGETVNFKESFTRRLARQPSAAVVYSPNGLLIAATSVGSVVIVDSITGRQWGCYDRDFGEGRARTLQFSPDGRFLAAGYGGPDGCVRVRDVVSGEVVAEFRGHAGDVTAVAFSPDGKTIASGGSDTAIMLWKFVPPPSANRQPGLAEAWDQLRGLDVHRAYAAMQKMAAESKEVPALIRRGTAESARVDNQMRAWLKDLEDNQYRIRKTAADELVRQGERALPLLYQALEQKLPLDSEQRIRAVVADIEAGGCYLPETGLFGEPLRAARAVRVLQQVGGPEAVAILRAWAGLKEMKPVVDEVQAALDYLRQ